MAEADPVALYEQATVRAIEVAAAVGPNQLDDPTPCAAWTVQDLLDHLVAGTDYLHSAIEGEMPPDPRRGTTAVDLRAGVGTCLAGLDEPDNLTRTCVSPLGFEWTVAEAAAGTFMDVLVHTWDLATATGQDPALDADLVDACIALFLPDMPERGRAAGIVGPAVPVPEDAPPQDRLLAAMGRTP